MTPRSTATVVSFDRFSAAAIQRGWRLDARRAMTLRPHVPSRLQITQGRAWVTLGLPHAGAGNESGDHMLAAGDSLEVPAGARLVMEPWESSSEGPVRFDWSTDAPLPVVQRAGSFQREVAAPSRELAVALGQAGAAFVRLVRGMFGYAEYLLAGRGRVLTPSDCQQR